MDFQHDSSWDILTSTLALKAPANEAWNIFIDLHEQIVPKPYWTKLRQIDIATEQAEIVEWLGFLLDAEPMPETTKAIWIGLVKFAGDGEREIPAFYIVGADVYDKEDIEWACDAPYRPDNGYAQLGSLQYIDETLRTDNENYSFLDWIFPLAYCAFTFDEVFRTQTAKGLLPKSGTEINIVVGHDDGDYIELTSEGG